MLKFIIKGKKKDKAQMSISFVHGKQYSVILSTLPNRLDKLTIICQ